MRFGLMYLFSDFGDRPQERAFHEFLEEVEYAEELGFDSVWLPEHHFSVYGMLGDTLTLAAAVAQRTRRIRIGTAVVLLPFNHPLRVAEQASLVDVLSGGRLLLGVGRGYQPNEFEGFGLDPADSREMFLEALEVLRRAFTEENFSYEGRFWRGVGVTLYPKPIQKPHPPIFLASVTPSSLDLAARYGFPILRAPRFTPRTLVQEQWEYYRNRMAEHGYDATALDQPMLMQTFVAETDEEARRLATPHAMWYHRLLASLLPGAPGRPVRPGYELYAKVQKKHLEVTEEEVVEHGSAFGSPETVARKIREYAETCGVNHWVAEMRFGGITHKQAMKSMEMFAKEVVPALRELAPA